MLESLRVKNLALIEEAEVEFKEGLNVLTGETGAGKSILIGSVNLALGAKADKDLIRTGKEFAYVELVFFTKDEKIIKRAEEMDIFPEDDRFIISRKISQGKSVSKINGETVTVKQIKELAELLLDIHGQHEHQSLLKESKQKEILDTFCDEKIDVLKNELKVVFKEYKNVKEQLSEEMIDENSRRKELSLAEFEYQEIEEAGLVVGEDEELENTYRKMVNSKRIMESLNLASRYTGNDGDNGAGNLIGRAIREIKSVESYDDDVTALGSSLMDIEDYLSDFNRNLHSYMQSMEFDESDFRSTEERLNVLNHLKAKYGNSIESVLAHQKDCERIIDRLSNYEMYKAELLRKEEKLSKEVKELCQKISAIRTEGAKILEEEIRKALIELNFLQVKFSIQVDASEDKVTTDGYDTVQMLISTNPGEGIRPLKDVVSGGELSRIMLAIKTCLASKDEIDTLVFDEIDTGISGKTAWMVSEKMGKLAKNHQLLCITHLPQIAARANAHLLIEKSIENDATLTGITMLSEEESVEELARMLGGMTITEAVLNNAAEMKKMAKNEL